MLVIHDGCRRGAARAARRALSGTRCGIDGFTVTPLVRTPEECVAAAADRLDSRTALLDARLIVGDPVLAGRCDRPGAWLRFAPTRSASRASSRSTAGSAAARAGSCAHDLAPGPQGRRRRPARHVVARLARDRRRAAPRRGGVDPGRGRVGDRGGRGVLPARAQRPAPRDGQADRPPERRSAAGRGARHGVRRRARAVSDRRSDATGVRARAGDRCARRRRRRHVSAATSRPASRSRSTARTRHWRCSATVAEAARCREPRT